MLLRKSTKQIEETQGKRKNMNLQMILGFVRHVLTASGGVLIAQGYTDPAGLQSIVGGICTVLGVAWSMYQKKTNKPKD